MPQAILQQHQVERGDGVAAAKEGAGLQQPQRFFPTTVGNVGSAFQRIQSLAQLEYQFKAAFGQFDLVDLRLPLVKFFVADAQGLRDRVVILILAADQQ
ncbi:hypothetical protein D3C79_845250 [compost metagenome]